MGSPRIWIVHAMHKIYGELHCDCNPRINGIWAVSQYMRQFQPHSYRNKKYGKPEIVMGNKNNKYLQERGGSTCGNSRAKGRIKNS